MPPLKTYNLFISHAWKYNDEYYRLVNHLKQARLFNFKNYSVPQHDPLGTKTPRELENALYRQIRPSHAVLVLAGMYVNHREWIQKEIKICDGLNIPIIAVRPWGSQRMPTELQRIADEVVGWNTQSIVTAIRKVSR